MSKGPVIAVDWGTSNFRAWLLDASGTPLERRSAHRGILTVENGAFEAALLAEIGGWLKAWPEALLLLSGMIGSRQGWVEMPYVACPAGLDTLAASMRAVRLDGGRVAWLTPGLMARPAGKPPDVMRGEEVQILGALGGEVTDAVFCVPGTHSKWVDVKGGRITAFSTHMTGELFDILCRHSILGRLMTDAAEGVDIDPAFEAGLVRAETAGGLLHHLFGVRSLGLFGKLAPGQLRPYLSGLLIGHEIVAALAGMPAPGEVRLIASPALERLYARALARRGIATRPVGETAGAMGLLHLSRRIPAGTREGSP